MEVWQTSNLRRLRLGEERKKKNKRQDENIMVCPIPQGDRNKAAEYAVYVAKVVAYSFEIYITVTEMLQLRPDPTRNPEVPQTP